MSCVVSCSTDSGPRNPSTANTFDAAGAGGGLGVVAGVEGGVITEAVESAGARLSIGLQAAPPTARAAHKIATLIGAPPPGSPGSTPRGARGSGAHHPLAR